MNALRPRIRPDYRPACVPSRHHRRSSSVRSPAGLSADRLTSGDASPAPSRKRPSPSGWVRRRVHRLRPYPTRRLTCHFAPIARRPNSALRSRSRRVHAHAIPGPARQVRRRYGKILHSAVCPALRPVRKPQAADPSGVATPPASGPVRSPALTHAAASRRETRSPPSSLRRLRCGVGQRVHRRSHIPQRGGSPRRFAPRARRPTRMATGSHFAARACARHTGTGTGLPNGVTGRQSPAPFGRPCGTVPVATLGGSRPASGPVRSPPRLPAAASRR